MKEVKNIDTMVDEIIKYNCLNTIVYSKNVENLNCFYDSIKAKVNIVSSEKMPFQLITSNVVDTNFDQINEKLNNELINRINILINSKKKNIEDYNAVQIKEDKLSRIFFVVIDYLGLNEKEYLEKISASVNISLIGRGMGINTVFLKKISDLRKIKSKSFVNNLLKI